MSELNVLDNRPLARASRWFLIDAGVVLVVLCAVMLHPDFVPEFFDHPAIHTAGIVVLTALYTLLATLSSVLGFLSNCRPGRTMGWVGMICLVLGLSLIVGLILAL